MAQLNISFLIPASAATKNKHHVLLKNNKLYQLSRALFLTLGFVLFSTTTSTADLVQSKKVKSNEIKKKFELARTSILANRSSLNEYSCVVEWSSEIQPDDTEDVGTGKKVKLTEKQKNGKQKKILIPTFTRHVSVCKDGVRADDYNSDGSLSSSAYYNHEFYEFIVYFKSAENQQQYFKKRITDSSIKGTSLFDIREYGSISGVDQLSMILQQWELQDVSEVHQEAGETLLMITLKDPQAKENDKYPVRWKLWLSPQHNFLPIVVKEYVGNLLNSTCHISYAEVPSRAKVYFPTLMTIYISMDSKVDYDYLQIPEWGNRAIFRVSKLKINAIKCDSKIIPNNDKATTIHDNVNGTLYKSLPIAVGKAEGKSHKWVLIIVNVALLFAICLFYFIRKTRAQRVSETNSVIDKEKSRNEDHLS